MSGNGDNDIIGLRGTYRKAIFLNTGCPTEISTLNKISGDNRDNEFFLFFGDKVYKYLYFNEFGKKNKKNFIL